MPEANTCFRCGNNFDLGQANELLQGICPFCLAQESMDAANGLHPPTQPQAPPGLKSPNELTIGSKFRGLEILEFIGKGGMGLVYKARHESLNRLVALKILSPQCGDSEEFAVRFDREAKTLASLNHPNIVQIYDFGKEVGVHFLVMEFVDGPTLEDLLSKKRPVEIMGFLRVLRNIAKGLRRVHEAGLVHRDVKPSNILIARDGTAKIGDFGLAVESQNAKRFTENGVFVGTPQYVSPEHAQGKPLDGRTDLYSMGVILYEGVTGHLPFQGSSTSILMKHIQENPAPLRKYSPNAPVILENIVGKLLAKNPDDRYSSALLLERDLEIAIRTLHKPTASDAPVPESKAISARRGKATVFGLPRGLIFGGGSVLLALLLVGVIVFLGRINSSPPTSGTPPLTDRADRAKPSGLAMNPPTVSNGPSSPEESAPQAPSPSSNRAGPPNISEPSPAERRRRLDQYVAQINLAGIAAAYTDARGMAEESRLLRGSMSQTLERISSLVTLMEREGQNSYVDDLVQPSDRLTFFDGKDLGKMDSGEGAVLLGTFIAKLKAGSRVKVGVSRGGKTEEFIVRFDERHKDLLSIVQVAGLIPGQEVLSKSDSQSTTPASTPEAPKVPLVKPASETPSQVESAIALPLEKKAVPEDTPAAREAEKLLREVFREEYERKSPQDKVVLAKKLLQQGIESKSPEAECFVLLREARDLASQGGDQAMALKAITELGKRFEIDEFGMKYATLTGAARTARTLEDHAIVARSFASFVDEAIETEHFEVGLKASAAGSVAATKGKEFPLLARLEAKGRECVEQKERIEKARMAAELLKKNPEDVAAHLILGEELCFLRQDWDSGLPHLAKGSDSSLRKLSLEDLSHPNEPPLQSALADAWWDLAEKRSGVARDSFRKRAGHWYRLALSGLDGISKLTVERRLQALSGGLGVAVNILKLINLKEDMIKGEWRINAEGLLAPAQAQGIIQIPYLPPEEYELKMVVVPKRDAEISLNLVHSDTYFEISVNGWKGTFSGIELIDGKQADANETTRKGQVLNYDSPNTINCLVQKNLISVRVNGLEIISWKPRFSRLSADSYWKRPHNGTLALGSWISYQVTQLEVSPLSGAGRTLR